MSSLSFCHSAHFDMSRIKRCKFNDGIAGPAFVTAHNCVSYEWALGIRPNGSMFSDGSKHEGIQYLIQCRSGPGSVDTDYWLFLETSDQPVLQYKGRVCFDFENAGSLYNIGGTSDTVDLEALKSNGWLSDSDSKLRLILKLSFSADAFAYERVRSPVEKKLSCQSNDVKVGDFDRFLFENLERSTSSTDFVLLSKDGIRFHALSARLAYACPYFESLFAQQITNENEVKECHVELLSGDVLREVLRYILLSETEESFISNNLGDMLHAAEVLELTKLKQICELHLIERLNSNSNPQSSQNSASKLVVCKVRDLLRMHADAHKYGLLQAERTALCQIAQRWHEVEANAVIKPSDQLIRKVLAFFAMKSRAQLQFDLPLA